MLPEKTGEALGSSPEPLGPRRLTGAGPRWTDSRARKTGAAQPPVAKVEQKRAEDRSLTDAICQKDKAALAEVYLRHAGPVHALARHLCGHDRADDLTQEIFLQLWRKPERYDADRGSLRSFLLVQAHSRSVDVLRSDGARSNREIAHDADRGAATVPDVAGGCGSDRDSVAASVSSLPDEERLAIVLAYFEGHTYSEVARLLAVPEGTIKSRIRRALSRLRADLGSVR